MSLAFPFGLFLLRPCYVSPYNSIFPMNSYWMHGGRYKYGTWGVGGRGEGSEGRGNRSPKRSTIHLAVRSGFLCLCLSILISPYGFRKTKLICLPPIEALNLLASLPRDLIEPELRVGSRRLIKTRTAHLPS